MQKFQNKKSEVKSPCTKRCTLDHNNFCPECYRSIDEIFLWPDAEDLMKRKILEVVKLRRTGIKK